VAERRVARRADVELRQREILDATVRVVADRGFAATRIQDVAAALGVSTGLVHYHFDSKDDLLTAAFRHAAAADIGRLEKSLAESADAVEQLDRLIAEYLPGGRGEKGWVLWIDAWGEALRDPALRRISAELDTAWIDALEAVISDGVTAGRFACPDPRAAAWRMAALMDGLSLQLVAHRGMLTRAQALEYSRIAAVHELGLERGAFLRETAGA
jgi:AcrR family transcriptional regulator